MLLCNSFEGIGRGLLQSRLHLLNLLLEIATVNFFDFQLIVTTFVIKELALLLWCQWGRRSNGGPTQFFYFLLFEFVVVLQCGRTFL